MFFKDLFNHTLQVFETKIENFAIKANERTVSKRREVYLMLVFLILAVNHTR